MMRKEIGKYERVRVHLTYQSEGDKDMWLLVCHCELMKDDTDSDTMNGPEISDEEEEEEEDFEESDSEDDVGQPYEQPRTSTTDADASRPSTDSLDIFFGCTGAEKTKGRGSPTISENDVPESSERGKALAVPGFSRSAMTFASGRFRNADDADQEPNELPLPPHRRQLSSTFSEAEESLSPSKHFELNRFPKPIDPGEPSSPPKSFEMNVRRRRAQSELNITPEFPQLRRSFSLRSRFSSSSESQFSDFNPNERRIRHFDQSKVGISPTFTRWVVHNAEEVPPKNICVDGRIYFSKGVSGKNSFFVYAKNLDNDLFHVIGHFRL